MYRLSVIIPVYNTEKYIAQCLRSALSQTLDSIEYILVDDCSPDGSMDVAASVINEFPERAADVRIITHEYNKGLPQARKSGMDAAQGEYVAHLDSDDWLHPDCYRRMYAKAVAEDADIVLCKITEDTEYGERPGFFDAYVPKDRDRRIRSAITLGMCPYIICQMVRRSFCKGLVTPPAFMAEDWMFTVQLALSDAKWTSIDESLYHYRVYASSGSHRMEDWRGVVRKMESEKANVEAVEAILRERGLERKYSREMTARKCNVKRLLFPALGHREARKIWRRVFPETNLAVFTNSCLPWEYKLKHLCALAGIYTPVWSVVRKVTGRVHPTV